MRTELAPRQRRRRGATALEYVLLAALVGIAIIAGTLTLRDAVVGNYEHVSETVDESLDY